MQEGKPMQSGLPIAGRKPIVGPDLYLGQLRNWRVGYVVVADVDGGFYLHDSFHALFLLCHGYADRHHYLVPAPGDAVAVVVGVPPSWWCYAPKMPGRNVL